MTFNLHRPARAVALAVAVSALAAPTASAVPAEQLLGHSPGQSGEQTQPVRVVQVEADHGFDWGDAGIGATGVLALAAIGAGAALATGHRPVMS